VHGGHTESKSDGDPEYFFSPDYTIRGPRWNQTVYTYRNQQPAAALWYHDHALGLTRLNVYTGMAGRYICRKQASAVGYIAIEFATPWMIPDVCSSLFWVSLSLCD